MSLFTQAIGNQRRSDTSTSNMNRNIWVICACYLRSRSDKKNHRSFLQHPLDASQENRYLIFLDIYEEIHAKQRSYEDAVERMSANTAQKSQKLKYLSKNDVLVLRGYSLMMQYPPMSITREVSQMFADIIQDINSMKQLDEFSKLITLPLC